MLNYQAAAHEGAPILGLLFLCTLSPMFFLIAWRLLVQYFKWGVPDAKDVDSHDAMYEAVVDALADSRQEPIELEITQ